MRPRNSQAGVRPGRGRRQEDQRADFNYFVDDDPAKGVEVTWKSHANLFYANWLNFVYQETPYDLADLEKLEW